MFYAIEVNQQRTLSSGIFEETCILLCKKNALKGPTLLENIEIVQFLAFQ